MKKDELFKKIYIRSEEDLPKTEGLKLQVMFKRPSANFCSQYYWKHNNNLWLEDIDWYLLPIEEPITESVVPSEDEIRTWAKGFAEGYDCHSSVTVTDILCEGAKWALSQVRTIDLRGIINKWELILQQDVDKNITYSRKVIEEILSDLNSKQ